MYKLGIVSFQLRVYSFFSAVLTCDQANFPRSFSFYMKPLAKLDIPVKKLNKIKIYIRKRKISMIAGYADLTFFSTCIFSIYSKFINMRTFERTKITEFMIRHTNDTVASLFTIFDSLAEKACKQNS